jgi:hypothetical protein
MLLELVPALEKKHWFACLTSPTLSIRGDVTVCRLLVEHGGVNIDGVDPAVGRTALHHASTCKLLVHWNDARSDRVCVCACACACVRVWSHPVESNCVKLVQCLLACGARIDIRAPSLEGTTALGMARQYDTPAARLVVEHSNESKRTRGNKRKRKSAAASHESGIEGEMDKKTQASSDGDGDGAAETTSKLTAKKRKKEPAAEKLQEKELEAEVRQLAKLNDDKAKLDVFTLRRMLRARGVLASDIPTRKLALLQLAADWLRAGN